MCGIAGIFGKGDSESVERMLARLIHRGPDDCHFVSGENYSLGARRLSIVGLQDGRQPLANEDRSIWAVQNGELYNYPQKKQELLAKNFKLLTACDTEIIPHLYQDRGLDFVDQIDGMFALALWDENRQLGVLARDRLGKKPLYYFESGGALYFASELKALLTVAAARRRIDFQALNYYFSFKHVPAPLTIFEGIKMLPPAHMLIYRPGSEAELRRYWRLDWSESEELAAMSEEELSDRLMEHLRRGVKRRFMADVPVGFFLSGGIDSSLTTALAAEISSEPIKTFTLTYKDRRAGGGSSDKQGEGKELDKKWARWTAERFATEHHEEEIEFSDFPQNLRAVIGCFDEPFCGTISTYFLSALISSHVKVAVSGDGADELFGSYLSHRLAMPLANLPDYRKTGERELISPYQDEADDLAALFESEDWRWRARLLMFQEEEKQKLFAPEALACMRNAPSASQRLKDYFAGLTATDPLNRVLEAEFRGIFPDQVLAFVDRLSMAHSLEIRSAFLDTELVEFAARVPGRLKIKDGTTKYILKKAASRYFPPEMVDRRKEGFIMPITDWLFDDLEIYVRDTLAPGEMEKHGIFDQTEVDRLIADFYASDRDYRKGNKLLSLLVFQEWLNQYATDIAHDCGVEQNGKITALTAGRDA